MREKEIYITENEIEQKWKNFLNMDIGHLCFILAIASLGTNDPVLYSLLSIIYVSIYYITKSKPFWAIIKHWRETKSKRLKGWKFTFNTSLFLYGYVVLWLVFLGKLC